MCYSGRFRFTQGIHVSGLIKSNSSSIRCFFAYGKIEKVGSLTLWLHPYNI